MWSHVDTDGNRPDGRDGHTACVINDSMYVFGGYVQRVKKFTNEIYEFNFKTSLWTLVQTKVKLYKIILKHRKCLNSRPPIFMRVLHT